MAHLRDMNAFWHFYYCYVIIVSLCATVVQSKDNIVMTKHGTQLKFYPRQRSCIDFLEFIEEIGGYNGADVDCQSHLCRYFNHGRKMCTSRHGEMRTFSNRCELCSWNCQLLRRDRKIYDLIHKGACEEKATTARPTKPPPVKFTTLRIATSSRISTRPTPTDEKSPDLTTLAWVPETGETTARTQFVSPTAITTSHIPNVTEQVDSKSDDTFIALAIPITTLPTTTPKSVTTVSTKRLTADTSTYYAKVTGITPVGSTETADHDVTTMASTQPWLTSTIPSDKIGISIVPPDKVLTAIPSVSYGSREGTEPVTSKAPEFKGTVGANTVEIPSPTPIASPASPPHATTDGPITSDYTAVALTSDEAVDYGGPTEDVKIASSVSSGGREPIEYSTPKSVTIVMEDEETTRQSTPPSASDDTAIHFTLLESTTSDHTLSDDTTPISHVIYPGSTTSDPIIVEVTSDGLFDVTHATDTRKVEESTRFSTTLSGVSDDTTEVVESKTPEEKYPPMAVESPGHTTIHGANVQRYENHQLCVNRISFSCSMNCSSMADVMFTANYRLPVLPQFDPSRANSEDDRMPSR